MEVKYKFVVKCTLLILFSLVLSGCNQSLVINDFNIDSSQYHEQGYFLPKRIVNFSVDIKNAKNKELDYKWTANGGRVLEEDGSEIRYLTPNLPGEYKLFLTVKDQSGEEIQHEFSFAVKGDYPQQVTLNNLTTTSIKSGIKINWSDYPKNDFYTYKILRSNNNFIDEEAEVIATITDQQKSSYIDYSIKAKEVYSYQVMVINKSGYLSVSNEKMIETLPQRITKIDLQGKLSDLVVAGERLYLNNKAENNLLILDAKTQRLKKKINWDLTAEKLFLTPQRNYLFALAENKKSLLRLNLEDYTQQEFSFSNQIKDLSFTKDELYIASNGDYNLLKFDFKEGEVVQKLKVTQNKNLINPAQIDLLDGKHLFIDKVFGESLIYDLNNLAEPISKFDIGVVKDSMFCEIDGQSCLYVANTHHPLQVYTGVELDKIRLTNKFDKISNPNDFVLDKEKKRIFVAVDKMVYIYSLENDRLIDKIKLDAYINHLAWNKAENKLYLVTSQINQKNYNLMIADLEEFSREDNI
ncbi:MAG: hypothetical protein R6V17_01955 [Halanaerobacter sp.]